METVGPNHLEGLKPNHEKARERASKTRVRPSQPAVNGGPKRSAIAS